MGIITKTAFLNEFYPDSEQSSIPDKFTVYHYNGLARSNQDNQVNKVNKKSEIFFKKSEKNSINKGSIH